MNKYLIALMLSTVAGLSTGIGGLITFFIKKNNMKVLSLGLGFSAGVMIFLSLVDLYPEAQHLIGETFGEDKKWLALALFFVGVLIVAIIDKFIPDHVEHAMLDEQFEENLSLEQECKEHHDHDHCSILERMSESETEIQEKAAKKMLRIKKAGIITAVAIGVHNFPEGLATFFASSADLSLGLSIVIAIAIHNIPEGIAVALPIYQATGSKKKAFAYSLLSGISEPIGGLIGFGLIYFLFPNKEGLLGPMFALIAGIMSYISLDTLLPLSREHDTGHYSIVGVILGMMLMGISLLIL